MIFVYAIGALAVAELSICPSKFALLHRDSAAVLVSALLV